MLHHGFSALCCDSAGAWVITYVVILWHCWRGAAGRVCGVVNYFPQCAVIWILWCRFWLANSGLLLPTCASRVALCLEWTDSRRLLVGLEWHILKDGSLLGSVNDPSLSSLVDFVLLMLHFSKCMSASATCVSALHTPSYACSLFVCWLFASVLRMSFNVAEKYTVCYYWH